MTRSSASPNRWRGPRPWWVVAAFIARRSPFPRLLVWMFAVCGIVNAVFFWSGFIIDKWRKEPASPEHALTTDVENHDAFIPNKGYVLMQRGVAQVIVPRGSECTAADPESGFNQMLATVTGNILTITRVGGTTPTQMVAYRCW